MFVLTKKKNKRFIEKLVLAGIFNCTVLPYYAATATQGIAEAYDTYTYDSLDNTLEPIPEKKILLHANQDPNHPDIILTNNHSYTEEESEDCVGGYDGTTCSGGNTWTGNNAIRAIWDKNTEQYVVVATNNGDTGDKVENANVNWYKLEDSDVKVTHNIYDSTFYKKVADLNTKIRADKTKQIITQEVLSNTAITKIKTDVESKASKSDVTAVNNNLQSQINNKIDKSELNNVKNEISNNVDTKVSNAVSQATSNLQGKIDAKASTSTVNQIKSDLQKDINSKANSSDLNTVKTNLQNSIDKKADASSVNQIDGRVTDIENELGSVNQTVQNQIKANEAAKKELDGKINQANSDLSNKINESTSTLTNSINSVQDKANKQNEEVKKSLADNVTTINNQMRDQANTLDSKIDSTNSALTNKINETTSTLNNKINNAQQKADQQNEEVKKSLADNIATLNNQMKTQNDALENKLNKSNTELNNRINQSNNELTNSINAVQDEANRNTENVKKSLSENISTLTDQMHKANAAFDKRITNNSESIEYLNDSMARRDATNLTESNVNSWKEKLGLGANSVASGNGSTATGEGSVASGDGSVASGKDSKATGQNATATGSKAEATGIGSTALGTGAKADGNHGTAVGESAKSFGENSTAIGHNAVAKGDNSYAGGSNSKAYGNNSVAIGNNSSAKGTNSVALGPNSTVSGNNSVAIGAGSTATENNVVSVGKKGEERRITNVADGINNHDAVNMGQFRTLNRTLTNNINKVGAGAAALANLHPNEYNRGDKASIAAAVGSYKNSQAMAIGAFYRPDRKTILSISGTVGSKDNMIGMGVTTSFGVPVEEEKTNDEEVSLLKKLVSALQNKMQAMEEKIAVLTSPK